MARSRGPPQKAEQESYLKASKKHGKEKKPRS
jgi:hypothetical protein